MENLLAQIEKNKMEIGEAIVTNKEELEAFRIKYLGTKGLVKTIMGAMKTVAPEQKREAGQLLNEFKIFTEAAFETFQKDLSNGSTKSTAAGIDVSLPGNTLPMGSRHPISIVQNKIISIFHRLGFAVAEGPEIEDDWHNFTALNLPENHPARDMQDTFYIGQKPDWLLRTHTSSVQIREMEKGVLPLRIICPGRVTVMRPSVQGLIAFLTRLKVYTLQKMFPSPTLNKHFTSLYRRCLGIQLRFVFVLLIFLLQNQVPKWISVA